MFARKRGSPATSAQLLARIFQVLPLLCPNCGPSFHDAVGVIQEVAQRLPLSGMTVSAYHPAVDQTGDVRALAGPLIREAVPGGAEGAGG